MTQHATPSRTIHAEAPLSTWTAEALSGVRQAAEGVKAAKVTHSTELITSAERELQAAVDSARDLDVRWGEIGSVLGIARGNAYQRYRKRASFQDLRQGAA